MSKGTERTLWTSCFIQVELTCYLPFVTFNKNSGFIAFLSGNILYVGLFVLLIWLYCCYIVDMLTDYYYTDEFYNKVNYAPRYQSARWDTFAFDDSFFLTQMRCNKLQLRTASQRQQHTTGSGVDFPFKTKHICFSVYHKKCLCMQT